MVSVRRKQIDRSTIEKDDYVLYLGILTSLFSLISFYFNIKIIGCMSNRQGYWIAYAFIGWNAVLTYILTFRFRSRIQGLLGILVGSIEYAIYIYWRTRTTMCLFLMIAAITILGACFVLYLIVGKRRRKVSIKYYLSKFIDSMYLSRLLVVVIGIVSSLIIGISYRTEVTQYYQISSNDLLTDSIDSRTSYEQIKADSVSGQIVFKEEDYQVTEVYGDEYSLKNNFDRISLIADEMNWINLDLATKQDCLIAIIECEARYKGLPYRLTIKFSDDMDDEIKGFYSHSEKLICLNNNVLREDSAFECMANALHEFRHAEQHAICEAFVKLSPEERNLLCFYGVDKWCENINDYVYGETSYYEYRSQILEEDSRNESYRECNRFLFDISTYQ